MDPSNTQDLTRLAEVRRRCYAKLDRAREERSANNKQFVGSHYGEGGSDTDVPVNMIHMAVEAFKMHLAARRPGVMVSTKINNLKPEAFDLTLALNHLLEEMDSAKEYQRWVVDAFMGMAILKVGLNASDTVEVGGFLHDVGQPYVECVDLDDFAFDTTATRWEDIEWAGNRYRMRMEDVEKSGLFDPKKVAELKAQTHTTTTETGGQHAAALSTGPFTDTLELSEHVWLWDIWLPKDGLFLTLPDEVADGMQLRPDDMLKWEGPECGPYHILAFSEAPSNILPIAPVGQWRLLHQVANCIWGKLSNQAQRQKTILAYQKGDTEDAEAINDTPDGKAVGLDNPQAASEVRYGGPDQVNLAMFLQTRELANWAMHNPEKLLGLAQQADTLGQEQILAAGTASTVNSFQQAMLIATRGVVKSLAWYLVNDPAIEIPIVKRVPGTDISIHDVFTPALMEGDAFDYSYDLQPFSMQEKTPQLVMQTMATVWERFILPAVPLMEAQGLAPDLQAFLRKVGELSNIDMDDLVTFSTPSQEDARGPVGGGQEQRQAPHTSRTYTRRSEAGEQSTRGNAQQSVLAALGNRDNDPNGGSSALSLMSR